MGSGGRRGSGFLTGAASPLFDHVCSFSSLYDGASTTLTFKRLLLSTRRIECFGSFESFSWRFILRFVWKLRLSSLGRLLPRLRLFDHRCCCGNTPSRRRDQQQHDYNQLHGLILWVDGCRPQEFVGLQVIVYRRSRGGLRCHSM